MFEGTQIIAVSMLLWVCMCSLFRICSLWHGHMYDLEQLLTLAELFPLRNVHTWWHVESRWHASFLLVYLPLIAIFCLYVSC